MGNVTRSNALAQVEIAGMPAAPIARSELATWLGGQADDFARKVEVWAGRFDKQPVPERARACRFDSARRDSCSSLNMCWLYKIGCPKSAVLDQCTYACITY